MLFRTATFAMQEEATSKNAHESCAIFDVASSCMAPVVSLEACHHAEQCMSL